MWWKRWNSILTQADSTDDEMPGTIADGSDESSTESMVQRLRRRLSLIWHDEADVVWHRDAGAAEGVVRNLASRIGAVPEGEVQGGFKGGSRGVQGGFKGGSAERPSDLVICRTR